MPPRVREYGTSGTTSWMSDTDLTLRASHPSIERVPTRRQSLYVRLVHAARSTSSNNQNADASIQAVAPCRNIQYYTLERKERQHLFAHR